MFRFLGVKGIYSPNLRNLSNNTLVAMLVYPMPPVVQAPSGRCKSTEGTGTGR